MTISLHKLTAILEMKLKAITSRNMIVYPVLTLLLTFGLRLIYGTMGGSGEAHIDNTLTSMALSMGLLFSTSMTGMMLPCNSLAEEKEKHTLRTLMTSSVNGLEFFLGSIFPTIIVVMIMNILLIPISGIQMAAANWPIYLIISLIATITSTIIGMLVGLFAKNQMNAGTMIMPITMLFTLLPFLGSAVSSLSIISKFLYTGVLSEMVTAFANNQSFTPGPMNIVIMIVEIILATGLFIYFYKRNGFEKD